MISSRWPRPIGTIESTDLRPVCTGCETDWRAMTPGATFSILSVSLALIGTFCRRSAGPARSPRGRSARADRHFENAAGGLDHVAFGDVLVFAQHHGADGVALEVQRQTKGVAGNSSIRPA